METGRRKFLINIGAGVAGFSLLPWVSRSRLAAGNFAGALARSSPELQGLASANVLSCVGAVEKENLGVHSFMLVRHGNVIAEGWWDPYPPNLKQTLFSL